MATVEYTVGYRENRIPGCKHKAGTLVRNKLDAEEQQTVTQNTDKGINTVVYICTLCVSGTRINGQN
jgi:hypothetical protein